MSSVEEEKERRANIVLIDGSMYRGGIQSDKILVGFFGFVFSSFFLLSGKKKKLWTLWTREKIVVFSSAW